MRVSIENLEKMRNYQRKNKARLLAQKKLYYLENKERIKAKRKEYIKLNKEKISAVQKAYYVKNKEPLKKKNKIYKLGWLKENKTDIRRKSKEYYQKNKKSIQKRQALKLKNDLSTKLCRRLRDRLRTAIKNNQKFGSAVKDLGCTVQELKLYLESKFLPGMTWDNHGTHGWHIDHIIPLSSFNLEDREQFLKACHYTNLQPLWAIDNLRKSSKMKEEREAPPHS